jgi:hypothetical protein
MAILILVLAYFLARFLVNWARPRIQRHIARPAMIELKIPAPVPATPPALCCGCVYAHIIRGSRVKSGVDRVRLRIPGQGDSFSGA